jgi:predicted CoA-substrate-specific enzyme activase
VIRVSEKGRSVDFIMNDKCAAGTGRFLEIIAKALEVDVVALGDLALLTDEGLSISSMCAVFAESEVVSLISEGHPREKIIAGVMDSIAGRVGSMVQRLGLQEPVMLTGGVAKNGGIVQALKKNLGVDLIVPAEPQTVGALGAACIAMDEKRGVAI